MKFYILTKKNNKSNKNNKYYNSIITGKWSDVENGIIYEL
jgi:hypothetical protein